MRTFCSLSHSCYAFGVSRVYSLLYGYGLIIIHSTFSLPSFMCHHIFLDFRPTFYLLPTYWYTFLIWYLLHIIHMFHWWFDHLSFLLFLHWHFLWLPLGPWLMRFLLSITSCTRGYEFDHWVFEPSFPSFLSPYHPGLRYVPCLKITLRPQDQMLSLTVFIWKGLCRLVEVNSLLCFLFGRYFWKHLVALSCWAYRCLIDFRVWGQSIDDIGFIIWLCIRYLHWGISPPFFEIPSHHWVVWLSYSWL